MMNLLDAKKALSVLGATIKKQYSFILPIENSDRNIFVFDKEKITPKKYPRKPGVPGKVANSVRLFHVEQ